MMLSVCVCVFNVYVEWNVNVNSFRVELFVRSFLGWFGSKEFCRHLNFLSFKHTCCNYCISMTDFSLQISFFLCTLSCKEEQSKTWLWQSAMEFQRQVLIKCVHACALKSGSILVCVSVGIVLSTLLLLHTHTTIQNHGDNLILCVYAYTFQLLWHITKFYSTTENKGVMKNKNTRWKAAK